MSLGSNKCVSTAHKTETDLFNRMLIDVSMHWRRAGIRLTPANSSLIWRAWYQLSRFHFESRQKSRRFGGIGWISNSGSCSPNLRPSSPNMGSSYLHLQGKNGKAEAAPCGSASLLHQRVVDKLGIMCANRRQGSRSALGATTLSPFRTEMACSDPITIMTQISMKLVGRPKPSRNANGHRAFRRAVK